MPKRLRPSRRSESAGGLAVINTVLTSIFGGLAALFVLAGFAFRSHRYTLISAGLVGKLVEIGDRYAKVEVAPGMKVEFLKSGLLGKDDAETAASLEKK